MCSRNKIMDDYQQADETVIIVFSAPRHSVSSCDVNHINIDGHDIVPAKTVKQI